MKGTLLSILSLGALGAAEAVGKRVNSGKNAKQRVRLSEKQRKAKNARKHKRQAQKKSRRRNRK